MFLRGIIHALVQKTLVTPVFMTEWLRVFRAAEILSFLFSFTGKINIKTFFVLWNNQNLQDSDDDWETDPDHVNVMSEEQQRLVITILITIVFVIKVIMISVKIIMTFINIIENCIRWGGARDTGTLDMDKFRWILQILDHMNTWQHFDCVGSFIACVHYEIIKKDEEYMQ